MMAYVAVKPTKAGLEEPLEQVHKIRITLSSKNVKNSERVVLLSLIVLWLFMYRFISLCKSNLCLYGENFVLFPMVCCELIIFYSILPLPLDCCIIFYV